MPLSSETIKERLRITFGSESQEAIAKKLKMSQGNVSKLLSGVQLPALDTLYTISEKYGISVDWLLGLSDWEKKHSSENLASYSVAAEVIATVSLHGNKVQKNDSGKSMTLEINDPLLKMLVKKSIILAETDRESYDSWSRTKLSIFDDKHLISDVIWNEPDVLFLASEANTEADWAEVWKQAKKSEDFFVTMMEESPSPFGR